MRYNYISKAFRNRLSDLVTTADQAFNKESLWESNIKTCIHQNIYKEKTLQFRFDDIVFSIPILNTEIEKITSESNLQTDTEFKMHFIYCISARIVRPTFRAICRNLLSNTEQSDEIQFFHLQLFDDKIKRKLLNSNDIKTYIKSKRLSIEEQFLQSFSKSSSLAFDNGNDYTDSNGLTDSLLDSTSNMLHSFVTKYTKKSDISLSLLNCNTQCSQQLYADDSIERQSRLLNADNSGTGNNI